MSILRTHRSRHRTGQRRHPGRGPALAEALPRRHGRGEVRRQRDGGRAAEAVIRLRHRVPAAGRAAAGGRARRRPADHARCCSGSTSTTNGAAATGSRHRRRWTSCAWCSPARSSARSSDSSTSTGHTPSESPARMPTCSRRASGSPQVDGEAIDIGLVGDIAEVRPDFVTNLLDDHLIPVISSIGLGNGGEIYNVNADAAAAALAAALPRREAGHAHRRRGLVRQLARLRRGHPHHQRPRTGRAAAHAGLRHGAEDAGLPGRGDCRSPPGARHRRAAAPLAAAGGLHRRSVSARWCCPTGRWTHDRPRHCGRPAALGRRHDAQLRHAAARAVARIGRDGDRRRRQRVPRPHRRHRHVQPRSRPPGDRGSGGRAVPATGPHFQPVHPRAGAGTGRTAPGPARPPRPGVLLPGRRHRQRGGPEDGAPPRSRRRPRAGGDRRRGGLLPRPHHGRPLRDRQPRQARPVPAAARTRDLRAVRRRRGAAVRRSPTAPPQSSWNPCSARAASSCRRTGYLAAARGGLRPRRCTAHRGRGPVRHRAHRGLVRQPRRRAWCRTS